MEKFDYTFLTCKGYKKKDDEWVDPDKEATELCSNLGKRGYRVIRWYVREDGVNHIVMEKRYR
jgi:hypothetical protein